MLFRSDKITARDERKLETSNQWELLQATQLESLISRRRWELLVLIGVRIQGNAAEASQRLSLTDKIALTGRKRSCNTNLVFLLNCGVQILWSSTCHTINPSELSESKYRNLNQCLAMTYWSKIFTHMHSNIPINCISMFSLIWDACVDMTQTKCARVSWDPGKCGKRQKCQSRNDSALIGNYRAWWR